MVTVNRSKAGVYLVGDDGYNFEDEDYGNISDITDWTVSALNEKKIIDLDNHFKVVKLRTAGSTSYMEQDFVDGVQDSGTIELYVRVNNIAGGAIVVALFDTNNNQKLGFGVSASKFVSYDDPGGDPGNHDIAGAPTPVIDTWYHVSIRFRCAGAGAYQGLAEDDFKIFINGTEYGDFNFADDTIDSVEWIKIQFADTYTGHIDAIAYDWDATYDIGDNLTLEEDATISNSLISQLKIHYPTTLEPTNVKFGGKTYEKYFPICVAKINPSEDIFLGCVIKITDTHTSAGATASEVIFKGEVVKKLTSKKSGYIPSYLIFSNAKEMDSIKPNGEYTKDTDGYISDVLTNYGDKLTEGTLQDGADLGTFTAAGDKSLTLITKQCCRLDGYIAYIDSSNGADNADLMYDDGSTDTGIDIDESSSTLRGLRSVGLIDEHINYVLVRGAIQADGTRAEGEANDTTSQGLYGIVPTYDTDTTLNTDALCASKAAQILADNEFGNKRVVIGYYNASKGMLQPGETVTFDWDATVHDIGFNIEQEQYIIAKNVYDVKTQLNILILYSSIYYPEISNEDLLQEVSHQAYQNSDNIATANTNIGTNTTNIGTNTTDIGSLEAFLAIGAGNAQWQPCAFELASDTTIIAGGGYIRSVSSTDPIFNFLVPLPTSRGGLSLYITKIRTWIYDADADDKITNTYLYGRTEAGVTTLETDATDYDTATTEETYTFAAARDCSSYDQIVVGCSTQTTTANELDHMGVSVEYYYA